MKRKIPALTLTWRWTKIKIKKKVSSALSVLLSLYLKFYILVFCRREWTCCWRGRRGARTRHTDPRLRNKKTGSPIAFTEMLNHKMLDLVGNNKLNVGPFDFTTAQMSNSIWGFSRVRGEHRRSCRSGEGVSWGLLASSSLPPPSPSSSLSSSSVLVFMWHLASEST